MGIREGLMLREYIDTRQQRMEEAKLKAALFGAQAKQTEAETQLLGLKMRQLQQYLQAQAQAALAGQAPPPGMELGGAGPPAESLAPDLTPSQAAVVHRGLTPLMTPDEQRLAQQIQLMRRFGLHNEAAQAANALHAQMRLRLQHVQDQALAELAGLEQTRAFLERAGQWTPEVQAAYEAERVGLFARAGKAEQAYKSQEEQVQIVPPGGAVRNRRTGKIEYVNPNVPPVVLPPGAGLGLRPIQTPTETKPAPPVTIQQAPQTVGDVAAERAAAGEQARAEVQMDLPLAQQPGDRGKYWYSTETGEEVSEDSTLRNVLDARRRGLAKRLPDERQRAQLENMQLAMPMLDEIDALLKKVYDPHTGAYKNITRKGRQITGFENLYTRFVQSDPDLEEAARTLDGLVERYYRLFTGTVGVQTEKDVARGKQLLPQVGGLQPDKPEVAFRLLASLRRNADAIIGRLLGNLKYSSTRAKQLLEGTPFLPGQEPPGTPQAPAAPAESDFERAQRVLREQGKIQ